MTEQTAQLVVAERYELQDVVGRGGYGVVYRAHDRREDKQVAVKVLQPGAAADASVVERMVREQQAMVALAGTQAVSAVDLCRMPSGALCLVMEWLEGEDLEQHLNRLEQSGQRMNPARVVEIIGAVADTLGKAHEIGIVHRDIKPANIFLMSNESGGVRLLDFGLSRMKSAATLTAVGTVMGSPSYIAPESWGGNTKLVDQRVDVYSLGVIAFRALSGDVPFAAASLVEKLKLVTSAPRPSLHALRPDLPPALDAWVEQALAIDPNQRFRTAPALHTALSEALGLGIPGDQSPPSTRAKAQAQVQNALKAALRTARGLFDRIKQRASSPPSSLARAPTLPADAVDQKSFIAEWLSGSEPQATDQPEEDVVNWLRGEGAPAAPSDGRPRAVPPPPPGRKTRSVSAPLPRRAASASNKIKTKPPAVRPKAKSEPPAKLATRRPDRDAALKKAAAPAKKKKKKKRHA